MKLITRPRARAEAQAAAIIADRLSQAADAGGSASLGVPGGRSVAGVLEHLARAEAPFEALHLFFVDERCVPLDDEESNYRVVEQSFLALQGGGGPSVPAGRVHPFRCEEAAQDLGSAAYEREFRAVADRLDVALLGVGEDGHVASLFPGRPELDETSRLFVPVKGAPKPPPDRMSATPALLRSQGTRVVLLFFGDGKRRALKHFVAAEGNAAECPARLLRDVPDLWVFTDIGAE